MDEKIEAVARALCRFDGRDPDQVARQDGGSPGFQQFTDAPEEPAQPLWKAYTEEAERFVVVALALKPLL